LAFGIKYINTTIMNSYAAIEDRISEALASIEPNTKPNFTKLAAKFAVPYSRLLNRSKGRRSRSDRDPVNVRLNDTEELAICQYLDVLEKAGLYARVNQIEKVANSILRRRAGSDDEPPVGHAWATRFLDRHPEYFIRKQRTLDIERKEAHERRDIEVFFERWKAIVEEYGINPADIYNFDETGFRIGMGRHQKIVTRDPKVQAYIESSTNRDYVTLVEAVSGDGFTLPPMVIINATTHREHWFPSSLDDHYLMGVSDSGYSNDELGLKWIHHFDRFTIKRMRGQYRLILFDGHESHTTFEFITFCNEKKIIPFCLPPHTTHFLQPLDVAIFQPYKHWHTQEVDEAARTGCTEFTRVEFLDSLKQVRQKTFKQNTILRGWRVTGLIPYNPDAILAQLQYENELREEKRCEDRQTPSAHSSSIIETPKTIRTITRYSQKILNGPEIHSRFEERLDAFVKGTVAIAHLAEELKQDLSKSKAAEKAREKRRQSRRRIFQSGGVLYAEEARAMVKKRDEYEVKKAEDALKRLKDQELKKRMAQAKRLAIDCKKHRRMLLKRWKEQCTQ
jgi:hypothetical protein